MVAVPSNTKIGDIMSWLGRSATASTAALAILFGGLVLVSLMVDGSPKPPPLVVGGRRMMVGVKGGLSQRTLEELKADDPFSNSKRRVPNGPDPVHNRGAGESGRSPGRA